jgi:hypothetical protein
MFCRSPRRCQVMNPKPSNPYLNFQALASVKSELVSQPALAAAMVCPLYIYKVSLSQHIPNSESRPIDYTSLTHNVALRSQFWRRVRIETSWHRNSSGQSLMMPLACLYNLEDFQEPTPYEPEEGRAAINDAIQR